MPRKILLNEPVKIGVATRIPNWVSLNPRLALICRPIIEKIVHTAKQTVNARVLEANILFCSELVTPVKLCITALLSFQFGRKMAQFLLVDFD